MSNCSWNISYKTRDGKTGFLTRNWSEKPTNEDAAILIRSAVLPENFLLVDTPRDEREPTVYLLSSYGVTITGIRQNYTVA